MFHGYFDKWKRISSDLQEDQQLFRKFCKQVFITKELNLTPEELRQFEVYRNKEADEYYWRKTFFWPLWFSGLVYIDTQLIIPYTKTNKRRFVINFLISLPLTFLAANGVAFYKERFDSHVYASELCKRYGLHLTDSERENEYPAPAAIDKFLRSGK